MFRLEKKKNRRQNESFIAKENLKKYYKVQLRVRPEKKMCCVRSSLVLPWIFFFGRQTYFLKTNEKKRIQKKKKKFKDHLWAWKRKIVVKLSLFQRIDGCFYIFCLVHVFICFTCIFTSMHLEKYKNKITTNK